MNAVDRRALRSVAAQFFINGALYASFLPRLPELRRAVGADLATIGLVLTLAAAGGLVGSWLTGWLVSRLGSRRTLLGGAGVVVVALPLVAFAQTPWQLLTALFMLHMGDVWTDASMNLQGSRLSARRKVPVMSRLHGLWSLGLLAGGAVAVAAAAAGVPVTTHFVVTAVVLGLALGYVGPGLLTDDADPTVERAEPAGGRSLALLALLGAAALVVELIPTEWATFRLAEDFGARPGPSGWGFLAMSTGMVAGRFGGDWAVHRMGRGRLTGRATIAGGIGVAVATLSPGFALSVAGFLLAGLGISVLFPSLYDDAARLAGRPGVGLGALTAGIRVGAIAAPVAVGALADRPGLSVGSAMAIVALPFIIMLTLWARRTRTPG